MHCLLTYMNSKMIKQIYKNLIIITFCVAAIILLCILITINGQEKERNNLTRSSSLSVVSTKDDKTDRIDYVDESGKITYAADKHYATLIKTKEGNSILEQYFDAEGNPAKQSVGYYAILREYSEDGKKETVTYLGADENPEMNYAGYAIIKRTYNDDGLLDKEFYFDTQGQPVKTYSVCSGCQRQYDDEGRNVTLIYLDANGNAEMTGQGYAIVHRKYYTDGAFSGRVEKEFYYDENDKPVKLAKGQYGIRKEYDEYGRANSITYLDINENPVVCIEGYATIKKTFYEDDSVCTETYYDEKGNPVALSEGQYGVLYKDGKAIYFDINGNPRFNLKNFLLGNHIVIIVICIVLCVLSAFCCRRINILILLAYLGFIIYITLLYRVNTGLQSNFKLFWSYRKFFTDENIRWQIIENIFLFIPLGTVLYRLYPTRKTIIGIVLLSVMVEAMQYFTGSGLCELDDIISNSLGGWFGYCFGKLTSNLKLRIKN